jgi:molecular chaperone HscB
MDHFAILNIEKKYDIDKEKLELSFIELQKKYHPDNNNEDMNKALEINSAYNILSDDLKRSIYLLKIHNLDIENESQRINLDENLLNDIFAQREYVEDLTDQELLHKVLEDTNKQIQDITLKLSGLFNSEKYLEAMQLTVEFKYLDNLKKIIKKKLY